jgi:hypothetical protein
MLRWVFLMTGALLVVHSLTQLAILTYVLSLFGVGPWTRSFYAMNVSFSVGTTLKLALGAVFMAIALALFRRRAKAA